VVGLNDKITITPVDSQENPEKNKPIENKPKNDQNENKSNNISLAVPNSVKEYFRKNGLRSIKYTGDK
jgi:hypothetical protein